MTRWEYKTLALPTETSMNDLGLKGWELVSIWWDGMESREWAVFKRPLPPETINVPYKGSVTTFPSSGWTGPATPVRPVGRSMELPEHLTRG